MVSAWYMDEKPGDQRDEHKQVPDRPVSLEELYEKTLVLYFKIEMKENEGYDKDTLDKIREERNYSYQDVCDISKETLPNYDEKLKIFFKEHLHADEEIRFCVKGSGFFDVRDAEDKWIRIQFVPGDLIILPAGIYHRFTLDHGNYIKAMRFFVGEPVWTPYNRPYDKHEARVQYVKALTAQAVA